MHKGNLFAAVLIFAAGALASCSGAHGQREEYTEKPVAVTLATATVDAQDAILASGQVEAVQTTSISTRMMGRIRSIYVKPGDKVRKGQLLVAISDEDIRAKAAQTDALIAEAEAGYATAEKDFHRFSRLYEEQSATAKELDMATLQYRSAKARLDAARQMRREVNASFSYSNLTAPFEGVITQKLAEAGGVASPGIKILTLERDGILQVAASIAETDIANIHVGDSATMEIASGGGSLGGRIFGGKVTQLDPSSIFTDGQYPVKISIYGYAGRGLYAGMFVHVRIPLKAVRQMGNGVVLVPSSAIVNHDDLTGIYTISAGNTALLRWVRLGRAYGSKVEVISGLSKGEKFISSSEGRLFNGSPVTINHSN